MLAEATQIGQTLSLFSRLLTASTEGRPLRELLADLAGEFELAGVGARWPLSGPAQVLISSQRTPHNPDVFEALGPASGLADRLAGGDSVETEVTDGRHCLVSLMPMPGREPGAVWLERLHAGEWPAADRTLLTLLGQLLARTDLFARQPGATIDETRLVQRLADAAVIAGRMAHDFDNILTGIMGFTELTMSSLDPKSQEHQFLTEVSQSAARGERFSQELHLLSRSGQTRPHPYGVAQAVEAAVGELRGEFPAVKWDIKLGGLPRVKIDKAPLGVVLRHLLRNAAEAMPAGGEVAVRGQAADLPDATAGTFLGDLAPGKSVTLTITDAGAGLPDEVRAKLFVQPFFTTKVGHRGLGLAVAYRELHAHRAGIRFDDVDAGTSVTIALPAEA